MICFFNTLFYDVLMFYFFNEFPPNQKFDTIHIFYHNNFICLKYS